MNGYLDKMRRERETLTALTTGIAERAVAEDRDVTEAEEVQVRDAGVRVGILDRQIAEFAEQLTADRRYADIISAADAAVESHPTPNGAGELVQRSAPAPRSIGEAFVLEGIADEWLAEGGARSRSLSFGSLLERATITTADAPTGTTFTPPAPITPADKPRGALSVMGTGQVSTDTVHYVIDGTEPLAGVVAEQAAKPEAGLLIEPKTSPVVTLAHWVQVTRQALADAAYLRSHIDGTLRRGVLRKLDQQVVAGTGVGGEITGLGATTNTTPISGVAGPGAILDAITAVETQGFTPNAIIGSPATLSSLVSGTTSAGAWNVNAMGDVARVQTMFGVPLVPDIYVPANTVYVSDFAETCTVWDRQQTAMYVGEQHADNFIKNILVLLAEGRFAFTVLIPAAVAEVTLTATAGTAGASAGARSGGGGGS